MNDKNNKSKKANRTANVLESLKEIGSATAKSFTSDLIAEGSKDFMRQMLGNQRFPRIPQAPRSGELIPGENIRIDEVLSGEDEENKRLKEQLAFERNMRLEEKALVDEKSRELQLEVHALMQEVVKLTQVTPKLAREVQVAALQAPVNPGIYHIIFFEKLIEFIKSFRERIENASIWLQSANKRAAKKNGTFWDQYQKHGGRRLLSSEDYSGRSAG